MSGTIVYDYYGGLYLNITNRCPCACSFCVRDMRGGIITDGSLWLEHEPSSEEILTALRGVDFSRYEEAVFCGFGEPCERLDELIKAARFIKENSALPVRLNTNGLGDLINKMKTAPLLASVIDRVSISLNAPDKVTYAELCRPVYGEDAYDAMLRFALDCKELIPDTRFTAVDVLSEEQMNKCKELCAGMGIPLRVRKAY